MKIASVTGAGVGEPSPDTIEGRLAQSLRDLAAAELRADNLEAALLSSRRIGMAMGILMERHRLTAEQAFDCLRDLSQRRNVKVRDLAEQLIYTGNAEQGHD